MTLLDLIAFLAGDEAAILRVADNRASLAVGFFFVATAGFARNYLRFDLRRRPQALLAPLVVSVLGSFGLYVTMRVVGTWTGAAAPPFWSGYLGLLGLYWLMAPMAWLYAFPFEAWLSRVPAVVARLALLTLVAAWRVVLLSHALSVVLRDPGWLTCLTVVLFADAVAVAAIIVSCARRPPPDPELDQFRPTIAGAMSGIGPPDVRPEFEHRPDEPFGCIVVAVGIVSAPFLLILFFRSLADGTRWQLERLPATSWVPPQMSLFVATACFSILAAALVIWGQRKQKRRSLVERAFASDQNVLALRLMAESSLTGFPFHWRPPAYFTRELRKPWLLDVLTALEDTGDRSSWVAQYYWPQLDVSAQYSRWYWSDEEFARLVRLLDHHPQSRELARHALNSVVKLEKWYAEVGDVDAFIFEGPLPEETPVRMNLLRDLERLAGLSRSEMAAEVELEENDP